jgi:uncharacterized protein (TIGR03067 family)
MQAAALVLVMTLAPADASAPPDGPPPASSVRVEDATELQGTWEVVGCFGGTLDWTESFKGNRWVFAGLSARLVGPAEGLDKPRTFRVNAANCPAIIDSVDIEGFPCPGIYRRTGNELLWADGGMASGLPSSFDQATGVILWTLRRVKK